jgi:hypothetical protein
MRTEVSLADNAPSANSISADHVGFLNPDEAARFLGLSTHTLAKLRVRGDGPRFCRAVRVIRYAKDDLVAWMKGHSFTSNAERYVATETSHKNTPKSVVAGVL